MFVVWFHTHIEYKPSALLLFLQGWMKGAETAVPALGEGQGRRFGRAVVPCRGPQLGKKHSLWVLILYKEGSEACILQQSRKAETEMFMGTVHSPVFAVSGAAWVPVRIWLWQTGSQHRATAKHLGAQSSWIILCEHRTVTSFKLDW